MNSIATLRGCTGCAACASVCNQDAISMLFDKNGFYCPTVDEKKCINCGKCTTVCYKYDTALKEAIGQHKSCFSAVNKDEAELMKASSGAVSIELMRECIKQGYWVVGVTYDVFSGEAVTKIAKSEKELDTFRGSKYFQSKTADAFCQIARDKSEQKYAVFGTPCQIYALSKIAELHENRDKFLLIDIFCHGCPSLNLWNKYLEYSKNKFKVSSFEQINFRSKNHGWHEYGFDFLWEGKLFYSSKYDDPFYELFFGMDAMNTACYDCIMRSSIEMPDIRIGDFWGSRFDEDVKGVSAVIVVNERGQEIFNCVSDKFKLGTVSFEEITAAQSYGKSRLCHETRRTELLELLSSDLPLGEVVKSYRGMLPLKMRIKRLAKMAIKHMPNKFYIKLKSLVHRLGGQF